MRIKVVAALSILVGCASPATPTVQPFESVTMAADSDAPGTWQPTPSQTEALATALPAYIADSKNEEAQEIHLLHRYVCVYRGVTIDGKRAIQADFLCTEALATLGPNFTNNWQTGDIGVDGGGACFFDVTYLPDDREFVDLHINASR